jgi:hypothetical protein
MIASCDQEVEHKRMKRFMSRVALAALVVGATAGVSMAQTTSTTTETKSFEIIAVYGNKLDVRLPEGTKELTVPADFRFTVDGKPLSVSELKPGMKGTATITTRTTVTPVTVTEVKNGTVMQRSGSSIIVRTDDGIKMFSQGDVDKRGVKMVKNGEPAQLSDFREGDRLSATIITSMPPKVMTEKEVEARTARAAAPAAAKTSSSASSGSSGSSAAASRSTASTSGSAPAGHAKTLPKTASSWPLVALASLLSLAVGLALTIRRRLV